jgi:DNA-binding HxlR family transcriptional regulator
MLNRVSDIFSNERTSIDISESNIYARLGQLLASGLLVKMEFKPFYSYYEITERGRR